MKENYDECYRLVRQHEGGFVHHKKDPGGATKWGVIQRNYDAYRRRHGKPQRSVKDLKESEAAEIYKKQYWEKVSGDYLPAGVDYAVYDFAVNSGVSRSAKYLQRIVVVKVDGIIGDNTLAAVLDHDPGDLVLKLCKNRMKFLRRLSRFKFFGVGWTRRVMGRDEGAQTDDHGVIDIALKMTKNDDTSEMTAVEAAGKGEGDMTWRGRLRDFLEAIDNHRKC